MEAALVAFLAPFLPALVKAGEKVIDETAGALASQAGKRAKALWQKIFPKLEQSPAGVGAAERVAASPEDKRAQGALELELEELFKKDGALKREVQRMIEEAQQAGVFATHGGLAVGGDVRADRGSIGAIGTVGGDVSLGGPRDDD
jgi:hypothetical protein